MLIGKVTPKEMPKYNDGFALGIEYLRAAGTAI